MKVREFSCKECKRWFTIHMDINQVVEDVHPGQVLELSYDNRCSSWGFRTSLG